MRFIERRGHARTVLRLLREHPVVVLLGARQVGKTTLAKHVAKAFADSTFFDAESRADAALLMEPELALRRKRGLVINDDVQLVLEILRTVRVHAQPETRCKLGGIHSESDPSPAARPPE